MSRFLQDLWEAIKDAVAIIVAAVGAAAGLALGGLIGGTVGTAIGGPLGAIIGAVASASNLQPSGRSCRHVPRPRSADGRRRLRSGQTRCR
ncbi:MAG: hypothetical protein C0524_01265 [Rhodobacter sp.]|nr:hypothetical protein [Rhodobacter sp.]